MRRHIPNALIVIGTFLITAVSVKALGNTKEDALLAALGAALIVGGWLWRQKPR